MNVTCEITDYTGLHYGHLDGRENPPIKVHSAWSDNNMVELEIGEKKYKVNAKELIRAVERASNANPPW